MDDVTQPDVTPADTDGQSPADTQTPDNAPAAESMSLEEAKKLRAEANSLRKRLKAIEDEKLSETERIKRDHETALAERDEARKELRQLRAQDAAAKAGARSARAVAALIPPDALDDGRSLRAALETLRKEEPDLFFDRNGSADGGQGRQAPAGDDMNLVIRRAAGRA